jgi:hypothetical protein
MNILLVKFMIKIWHRLQWVSINPDGGSTPANDGGQKKIVLQQTTSGIGLIADAASRACQAKNWERPHKQI